MANRISTIFEFSERGNGLKKIRADVQAADGATGKLKAGWQGAMSTVKAYGAEAAFAVGTTLVAGAVKAGQEFANAAVGVGRFADATGLTTEQASKWVSVADDLEVSAADVEKAFLRLNKEIGEGGGVAEQYGIKLQRTADGQADVNETMLQAIDVINGIENPTERARVAQELFGRSYANVAEIIFKDADKVREALESTSDAQIFDEDEVRKAREYREAMDRLGDALVDLKLAVGEEIVPVLADLANGLIDVKEAAESIPGVPEGVQLWWDWASPKAYVDHVARGWRFLGESIGLVNDEMDRDSIRGFATRVRTELGGALSDIGSMAREARDRLADMGGGAATAADIIETEIERARVKMERFGADGVETMNEVADAAAGILDPFVELQEKLDAEDTFDRLAEALERVKATPGDRDETRRLLELVLDLGRAYEDIPPEVITKIFTQIDRGQFDAAFNELQGLANQRSIRLQVSTGGTSFRIDPSGGAPTQIQTPTTINAVPNVTNNYFTISPEPSQVVGATNSNQFANGARTRFQ